MVRWEPGTKERLQAAALRLFLDRGFEQTTVQDIAEATGLTERTFFRHFADKREVLFQGQQQYLAGFLRGIRDAPEDTPAFGMVLAALAAAAVFFPDERRPWSRQRQTVIDANPALQERESLKRAALGNALTAALQERGIPEVDARLAAEAGSLAFHLAFRSWIAEGEERSLLAIEDGVLARMAALVASAAPVQPI